ncbi:MAG: hypothetical protein ACOC97_05830 [Myxococcota bacterium]
MTATENAPHRPCPRCQLPVHAERFQGVEGVTWLWRCRCGWSGAVSESGVVSRRDAQAAIEERTGVRFRSPPR